MKTISREIKTKNQFLKNYHMRDENYHTRDKFYHMRDFFYLSYVFRLKMPEICICSPDKQSSLSYKYINIRKMEKSVLLYFARIQNEKFMDCFALTPLRLIFNFQFSIFN
jgi:hypothetical protein